MRSAYTFAVISNKTVRRVPPGRPANVLREDVAGKRNRGDTTRRAVRKTAEMFYAEDTARRTLDDAEFSRNTNYAMITEVFVCLQKRFQFSRSHAGLKRKKKKRLL